MKNSSRQFALFALVLLFLCACNRPLFVTHWSDKGKAFRRKKGYGWPNHGFLSGVVCMNKICLNKRERMNFIQKKKFKGFKKNTPQSPYRDAAPVVDSILPWKGRY